MTNDARAAAFATAWQIADSAAKWRDAYIKQTKNSADRLPDTYWAMIQEARIFVDLAGVGADVGIPVADWLQEQERLAQEAEAMKQDSFSDFIARKGDEHSCTCEFNKYQCPVHNPDGEPEEGDDDGPA